MYDFDYDDINDIAASEGFTIDEDGNWVAYDDGDRFDRDYYEPENIYDYI